MLRRQDPATTHVIDLVQRAGVVVEQVEQTMIATLADGFAAQHLEIPIGAPRCE